VRVNVWSSSRSGQGQVKIISRSNEGQIKVRSMSDQVKINAMVRSR